MFAFMRRLCPLPALCADAGRRALRGDIWNPPCVRINRREFGSATPSRISESIRFLRGEDVRIYATPLSIRFLLFTHDQDNGPFGATFKITLHLLQGAGIFYTVTLETVAIPYNIDHSIKRKCISHQIELKCISVPREVEAYSEFILRPHFQR